MCSSSVSVVDGHPALRRARVAYDVGDRLLDDPVRGQLDVGGYRPSLSPPSHLDANAGLRGGGDQPVHVGQSRCRAERRRFGVGARLPLAQPAEDPPQPGERLPAGGFDRPQRVAGLGRLGVHDPAAHTGLDRDDADAVRDHVVQFAGDAQPLGGDRLDRGLGAERLGVPPAGAHGIADHPGGDHRQGGDLGLEDGVIAGRVDVADGDLGAERHNRDDDRDPAWSGRRDEAHDEVDGQQLQVADVGQVFRGPRVDRACHDGRTGEHQRQGRQRPAAQQAGGQGHDHGRQQVPRNGL